MRTVQPMFPLRADALKHCEHTRLAVMQRLEHHRKGNVFHFVRILTIFHFAIIKRLINVKYRRVKYRMIRGGVHESGKRRHRPYRTA